MAKCSKLGFKGFKVETLIMLILLYRQSSSSSSCTGRAAAHSYRQETMTVTEQCRCAPQPEPRQRQQRRQRRLEQWQQQHYVHGCVSCNNTTTTTVLQSDARRLQSRPILVCIAITGFRRNHITTLFINRTFPSNYNGTLWSTTTQIVTSNDVAKRQQIDSQQLRSSSTVTVCDFLHVFIE